MIAKIVADECVDFTIIEQLRMVGVEVISIMESDPSIPDSDVLSVANQHKVLLITEDKDFGELVFRMKMPNHGVLLLRFWQMTSEDKADLVVKTLERHYEEMKNNFAVLSNDKLRIKKMS